MSDDSDNGHLGRRQFLQRSVAATVGAGAFGLAGLEALAADPAPRVRRYTTLGRTGLEMSDISFGTGGTKDPDLVRYAFDRGITYFDTAESYPLKERGLAETALGQALQGKRDKVVLATKTGAKPKDGRHVLMQRLNRSLRRLQTDYVDIYFNHAVNDVARLRNSEWFEFVERAKKQGKIRFSGMSGHGGNLIDCLKIAIDEDLFDVLLVAHNFGQDPAFYEKLTRNFDIIANQQGLLPVLKKAHAKGIGVVAMKTLMGARLNDMRPYEWQGATFAQAAFRWVLSNPDIDGLVVSMKSRGQIDEYLKASGRDAVGSRDMRLLGEYAKKNSAAYCRIGCNTCEASCPENVPISDVLRTRMYAADYGDLDLARGSYAELGSGAASCLSCSHQSCTGACPYSLDIPTQARSTVRLLQDPDAAGTLPAAS